MKNKKLIRFFISAGIVVILDQLTKFLVRNNMELYHSIPVINNVFHITYLTNTGSLFGILKGFQLPLIFLTFIIMGTILYYLPEVKEKEKNLQAFMGFVFGAAVGNLIDRLLFGAVIDFLDFRIWPVFNIADSFICVSVIYLVVYFWKK